ncbi:MAG: aminopeptidase [Bacillota bacterium]|nr:aminopeptidase [Bacillota bacterium]MDD3298099.1 aminopeptidase [Bacillota bacterium]MDD3851872.1 aminopeptidase [Bacillota bacterium]MDD4707422.1 aminopeptidase [Bacillota bacterium]
MAKMYEYELGKASDILMRDMFELKPGETVVITADTESDERVVNAAARSAFALGAKPMVIWLPAAKGVGKAADPMLPVDALTGALSHADAWVEFNNKWLLYSTPFEIAMKENPRLRYLCLVGMDSDLMVRTIGRVDKERLAGFLHRVADMTGSAKTMRITTPAGCNLEFEIEPRHKLSCDDGSAGVPGMHMLAGQICFIPRLDSINGTLVFDGSLDPPCGLLKEPVVLKVEKGRVIGISGGSQAEEFKAWLESFDDPNMFRLAHGCYGFNPGAKLTGNILEDERVWGCTEWGLGYLSPIDAPPVGIDAKSHTDGICLNSSVWLDGVIIMDKGRVVHPKLNKMVEKIMK